ncbi:hypothetical protein Ancab_021277 [Ancistrocladus abbreviatus]
MNVACDNYSSPQINQFCTANTYCDFQPNDPSLKSSQAITKFLPLMIGYFALSVPSGLSLYWFTNNILSTAQQVWLQKSGGAKNPLQQIHSDIFKEQSQMQRSISEIKSTQTEEKPTSIKSTQTEENTTSTGLRRGERFKQLKEEEARRKHEREEEKRKAEEGAISAGQTTVGDENKHNLVEAANGTGAQVVDERSENDQVATTVSGSLDNEPIVNGDASAVALEEHQNTRVVRNENSRPPSDFGDGKGYQPPEANPEKETVDILDKVASTESKIYEGETSSQK